MYLSTKAWEVKCMSREAGFGGGGLRDKQWDTNILFCLEPVWGNWGFEEDKLNRNISKVSQQSRRLQGRRTKMGGLRFLSAYEYGWAGGKEQICRNCGGRSYLQTPSRACTRSKRALLVMVEGNGDTRVGGFVVHSPTSARRGHSPRCP